MCAIACAVRAVSRVCVVDAVCGGGGAALVFSSLCGACALLFSRVVHVVWCTSIVCAPCLFCGYVVRRGLWLTFPLQETVEVSRPFHGVSRAFEVPGAVEMSVHFDGTTNTSSTDEIWVSKTGEKVPYSTLVLALVFQLWWGAAPRRYPLSASEWVLCDVRAWFP